MLDFIKAHIIGFNQNQLIEHPFLNFCGEINPITGVTRPRKKRKTPSQTATYKNLEFEIFDTGTITIEGSLHKFWNNGKHNYNDYDIIGILESLNEIHETFGIHSSQMILKRVEIGINFVPPYKSIEILKHIFMHKTTNFIKKEWSNIGMFIQASHSQYIVKTYDKANQYRCMGYKVPEREIMRFEIQFTKMERLRRMLNINKNEILTLQKLLNMGSQHFSTLLTDDWSQVLMYDFTIISNSRRIPNYRNPLYWNEKLGKASFYKHKKILDKMTQDSSENLPELIKTIIANKSKQLIEKGIRIDTSAIVSNSIPHNISIKQNQKSNLTSQVSTNIIKTHHGLVG